MSIANYPQKSIEISNVGPIEHLSIPVPPEGGVVVLNGGSGVGKTTGVQAVAALNDTNARKTLHPSDRFPSGKIEGLGVTVRLGRSNTVRGELECHSLDSGIDPSLLVDPGIKDPSAADSKRLATLVRLAGIKIDAAKWSESVGQFADAIALRDLVSDDPVQTADKVRRRLHDSALTKERLAQSKGAEGAALLKSIADIELPDGDQIDYEAMLESANQEIADLKARRTVYLNSKAGLEAAKAELASAKELELDEDELQKELRRHLLDMDDANEKAAKYYQEISELRAQIEQLEDQAKEAETRAEISKSKAESANQRWEDAEVHNERIAKLETSINQTLPVDVTQEEIDSAQEQRQAAMAGISDAKVESRARETKKQAEQLTEEANGLAAVAETMREIARSTDSVLEQALIDAGFDSIKVHDGRLCVESDRGLEPVSELSTGERWRLALDLAAKGLPSGSILTVQQEGWQSLDDQLKQDVAAMAKERGLLIVTASVSSGPLRVEVV